MSHFDWLNEASELFLKRGYLREGLDGKGRVREMADEFGRRAGKEYGDKFYDYMGRGFYSLSSPAWGNYGPQSKAYSVSCFGTYFNDSIPSILQGASEIGSMSQKGGGCSGYMSNIRPRGSKVNNGRGSTSGVVHFLELYETLTAVISQSGVRRGFFTPYLDADHGDAKEFIRIGSEGHPIQALTSGLNLSDEFMNRVVGKDMDALGTWAEFIKNRKEVGYPYAHFTGNANNYTVDVYKDKGMEIVASNMCVTPETKILTDKGHITISSLSDENVTVWNGKEWSDVVVRKTGERQEILKVVTDNGMEVECTPYHKFYVQTGYGKADVIEKTAKDLKIGDKLIKVDSLPIIHGVDTLGNAYANGFYSGDGCLTSSGQRVYLYHEKRHCGILDRMGDIFRDWKVQEKYNREYGHTSILMDKFFVPMNDYTVDSRIEWLAGLFDADGCVARNGKTQSLQLSSINHEFMKDLQMMLQTLGVSSRLNYSEGGSHSMPTNKGDGGYAEYQCNDSWRITISQFELGKLIDLGIRFNRLDVDYDYRPNRASSHFIKVASVENEGRISDTYCFTEHKRGLGIFNGILTGQCQEIELPSSPTESFVCVLSSMNALKWDEWKDTDAVRVLARFLDTMVDDFTEKLEAERDRDEDGAMTFDNMKRAYRFAKRHRALGIGSLGLHDLFMSKMIAFDSDEADELDVAIHKRIQEEAWAESRKMAEELGEPEVLKGYGRRNTTLTAIAPTKSSSFLLGQVSQGVEPRMSNYYIEDLAKTKDLQKNQYLKALLSEKGMDTRDVWKGIAAHDGSVQHLVDNGLTQEEADVFATFGEISPYAIVDKAAARQAYVDQGQSINLMLGSSFSPREISQLYIHAWKVGLKGLYYSYNTSSAQELTRKAACASCSL